MLASTTTGCFSISYTSLIGILIGINSPKMNLKLVQKLSELESISQ